MQKIFALLKLRLSQGYRMLDSVGWLLVFIFLFTIIGVGLQFLQTLVNLQAYVILILSFLMLMLLDYARPDKSFLSSIFQSYLSLVSYLWVEYFLILIPIVFYQCWIGNYFFGLGLVLVAILVASLSPLHRRSEFTHVKQTLKWIPIHNFELKIFCRKIGLYDLCVYNTWLFVFYSYWCFCGMDCFVLLDDAGSF